MVLREQDKMTKPTAGQDDKANRNSTYSSITVPLKTPSKQHPKLCQNSTQNSFRTLLKPNQNTTQNSLEFHPEHHQTTAKNSSSDPPNPIRRNTQSFVRTCQRGFVGRRRKTDVAVLYLRSQSGPWVWEIGTKCFVEENERPCAVTAGCDLVWGGCLQLFMGQDLKTSQGPL